SRAAAFRLHQICEGPLSNPTDWIRTYSELGAFRVLRQPAFVDVVVGKQHDFTGETLVRRWRMASYRCGGAISRMSGPELPDRLFSPWHPIRSRGNKEVYPWQRVEHEKLKRRVRALVERRPSGSRSRRAVGKCHRNAVRARIRS